MPVKPPARTSAVPQESIDNAKRLSLASIRGRASAEGVFAEIDVALKNHHDTFGPTLKQSFSQKLQTVLPSLGIKSTDAQQLQQLTDQIAEATTNESFEKLGKIQDVTQINEVLADSLTANLLANVQIGQEITQGGEKLFEKLEKETQAITTQHQNNLERSATLGTISRVAHTSIAENPEAIQEEVQGIVEEDSPLATPQDQAILSQALNNYQKEFHATLAAELKKGEVPTFEQLQKIQSKAHDSALAVVSAKTPNIPVDFAKLAGNFAAHPDIHLAPLTVDQIETYGLGYTKPKNNAFTKGARLSNFASALRLSSDTGTQQQAYLTLLALDRDRLGKSIERPLKRLRDLSAKKTLSYSENQERLELIKELEPYQEAQEFANKQPKKFTKTAENISHLDTHLASRSAYKATKAQHGKNLYVSRFKNTRNGYLATRTWNSLSFQWNVFTMHIQPTAIFGYINFRQAFYHSPSQSGSYISSFNNFVAGSRSKLGLSSGISMGRSTVGIAKKAVMLAKGTNPAGWAILLLSNDKIRKAAAVAAALVVGLLLNFGMHILGAIVGATFGAITGIPLLFIPGAGPFLYAGWVGAWTGYGFINPYGMFNIAAKALQLPGKIYGGAKDFFSGAGQGASGITSSIGSFGSSLLGGAANVASAIWGGAVQAGGGFLSGLASGANFVTGALSSATAFSTTAVSTVVGSTLGAVGVTTVVVGTITAASFVSLEREQAADVPGDNQYLTITKVADEPQMPNPPPDQNRTFTIKLVAKTKLTEITISDKTEARSASGTSQTQDSTIPCQTGTLEAGQECTGSIVITVTEGYTDSTIINTATVTATPEGQSQTQETAIATVRVGNPPTKCTQGWPTRGSISQGPEGSASHGPLNLEALDIASEDASVGRPVFATVDGIVIPNDRANSANDKTIDVRVTSCPTLELVRFQHLSAVNVSIGQEVKFGQEIGKMGSNCRSQNDPQGCGPHVHYQFNVGNRNYRMEPPNIPQSVPRTCSGNCNVTAQTAP